MDENGKQVKPNHWLGLGHILAEDEALERGLANALCKVFGNAPRGYLRVYILGDVRRNNVWVGPHILKGELVELTA